MKWKRWLWLSAGLSIVAAVTVAFEPTHVGRGILRGEAFHRGRPTSYWREILRADGQAGVIGDHIVESFNGPTAIPVLLECLEDQDRNVRWPAINRLGRFTGRYGSFTDRVLPGLRKALVDEDPEVRLQAVLIMGGMGPNARRVAPQLARLLHDPEIQVSHYADVALWEVDSALALEAGGWKRFSSEKWGFSAVYPADTPVEKQMPVERWGSQVVVHSFTAAHGVAHCVVGVSEYPGGTVEAASENERLDSAQGWIVVALGGKLSRQVDIEQNGLKGRECEIEVEGMGMTRTRLFWVGHRLYQVLVAYKEEFLNTKAADFFLDSFTLDKRPSSTAP
jgi:hypothetical protein